MLREQRVTVVSGRQHPLPPWLLTVGDIHWQIHDYDFLMAWHFLYLLPNRNKKHFRKLEKELNKVIIVPWHVQIWTDPRFSKTVNADLRVQSTSQRTPPTRVKRRTLSRFPFLLRSSHLAGRFRHHLFELGEQPTARSSMWTHTERLRLPMGSNKRLQQKTALHLPVWYVFWITL